MDFFVIKKISKTSFKPYNFWIFESPAINDLDCIMTLEVFEKILCTGGLVMWVYDWPLVQGTGVQILLEPNFFFLYWWYFSNESYFLLYYDILSPFYITPFSSLSCLLDNILNLNTKSFGGESYSKKILFFFSKIDMNIGWGKCIPIDFELQ